MRSIELTAGTTGARAGPLQAMPPAASNPVVAARMAASCQ
jgi:hypothetical protein